MLIFSLEELEEIFGYVDIELVAQIYSDMREIRKACREEFGFIKARKVTNKKIFRAFVVFQAMEKCDFVNPDVMNYWDEFVDRLIIEKNFEHIRGYI